jgi:hypothetical protein
MIGDRVNAQPTSTCRVAASTTAFDTKVRHRTIEIDGVRVFYREAGSRDAPLSSSCMDFRRRRTCSAA